MLDKFPDEETGAKFDTGKPDYSILEKSFLDSVSYVLMHGEKKYGRDNWKKGLEFNRLFAACCRHLFQYKDESKTDSESGLNHLAHAACNIMFMIYLEKNKIE